MNFKERRDTCTHMLKTCTSLILLTKCLIVIGIQVAHTRGPEIEFYIL